MELVRKTYWKIFQQSSAFKDGEGSNRYDDGGCETESQCFLCNFKFHPRATLRLKSECLNQFTFVHSGDCVIMILLMFSTPSCGMRKLTCRITRKIVKPWPQTLSPRTPKLKKPKLRGRGLTLNCCRPPTTHPPTP